MSQIWITVFGIGFIFVMTALGAGLVYFFKKGISATVNAAFSGFASGIMLAASVWSLLLPAIEQAEESWGNFALIHVLASFLFGGVFLLIFDKLTRSAYQTSAELKRSAKLFFAVTLHNVPEGLAVGFAFGAAYAAGTTAAYLAALGLAIGIGIQNFPEGAAVSLPLYSALGNKNKAFLYGAASGLAELIFGTVGYYLAAYLQWLQPVLLAFSAGAMVFVVAEELIPDSKSEGLKISSVGAWGVMIGFAVMMALDVALG
ncbi:MAG: ZIP family metal transporter [Clostridia bacterium]|nr:ZIP family metal transporter [Clostridia bacterium]